MKRRQSGAILVGVFLMLITTIFFIWLRQMLFYNRDDATTRRIIWLRQMRDENDVGVYEAHNTSRRRVVAVTKTSSEAAFCVM